MGSRSWLQRIPSMTVLLRGILERTKNILRKIGVAGEKEYGDGQFSRNGVKIIASSTVFFCYNKK